MLSRSLKGQSYRGVGKCLTFLYFPVFKILKRFHHIPRLWKDANREVEEETEGDGRKVMKM